MRVADYFLDHTRDLNHRDTATRSTLLLYAAKWQEAELVEKLLGRGARTDVKDWEGRSALDRAVESENSYLGELAITKQDPSQHAGLATARRIKKLLGSAGSARVAP